MQIFDLTVSSLLLYNVIDILIKLLTAKTQNTINVMLFPHYLTCQTDSPVYLCTAVVVFSIRLPRYRQIGAQIQAVISDMVCSFSEDRNSAFVCVHL